MSKNEQVKKFIEAMVQREVKRLLPEAVKQVMSGMIMESAIDLSRAAAAPSPLSTGNSHKRRAIQEGAMQDEEWPTLGGRTFDSGRMAELLGYGDMAPNGRGGGITVDAMITENGTPVPIDPSQIAPEVMKAMNRDYSDIVKAWDRRKNG